MAGAADAGLDVGDVTETGGFGGLDGVGDRDRKDDFSARHHG